MGWSTTIIPPPDGNLAAYLESLDLVAARDDAVLWPTHGPPVEAPGSYLEALRAHRADRTRQILRCIGSGISSIEAMVAVIYSDKPEELHKPAARSVEAHLVYLVDRGDVACDGPPGPNGVYSPA